MHSGVDVAVLFFLTSFVIIIENADATPPHLKVFPAVGRLSGIAWFCADLCDGQLSVFFQEGSSA